MVYRSNFGRETNLLSEFCKTLRSANIGKELVAALTHDRDFLDFVNLHRSRNLHKAVISCREATEILGQENVLGLEDAQRLYGIKKTEWGNEIFKKVLYTHETLEQCKDDYVLVPIMRITIADIMKKFPHLFRKMKQPKWDNSLPMHKEKCVSHETVDPGWYLIRKEAVPGTLFFSTDEEKIKKEYEDRDVYCKPPYNFDRMCDFLYKGNDTVPMLCQMVYASILRYLVTGQFSFTNHMVVCRSTYCDTEYPGLGFFDGVTHTMSLYKPKISHRSFEQGLAGVRRFDFDSDRSVAERDCNEEE